MTTIASRWSELCDLVFASSLHVLRRLAPETAYWRTLYDYLHVESYTLKLQSCASASASVSEFDVDVVVHEGPMRDTCAYEMQPTEWKTFSIPNDIPILDSQQVFPLDHARDLKGPPKKVQLSDGTVAFFLPCKASARRSDGTVRNESHQLIASILSLHSLPFPRNDRTTHARIPKVLGVLSDRRQTTRNAHEEEETKMAGLFLEWIDGFRLINLGLHPNSPQDSTYKYGQWKEEVTGLVEDILRLSSSSVRVMVNPFSILIDRSDGHTWMTKFCIRESEKDDDHDSLTTGIKDSEQNQIRRVFDYWLKDTEAEISRLPAEVDQQEIREKAVGRWHDIRAIDSQP